MFYVVMLLLYTSALIIYVVDSSNNLRTMEPFIVGGEYVKIRKFPHAAFLDVKCGKIPQRWMCGSVILNQVLVLTAAHCVNTCNLKTRSDEIFVYAGHEEVKKSKIMRKGKISIHHEGYNKFSTENDVGLILLGTNLPMGENVKKIILKRNPTYANMVVAGWGLENDKTGYTSKKLKSAPQEIKQNKMCRRSGVLYPGMFCAGSFDNADPRPSAGDSGSGLINGDNEVLGLVSWRNDNYPGVIVYSNTSYFYNWIVKTANSLYCLG